MTSPAIRGIHFGASPVMLAKAQTRNWNNSRPGTNDGRRQAFVPARSRRVPIAASGGTYVPAVRVWKRRREASVVHTVPPAPGPHARWTGRDLPLRADRRGETVALVGVPKVERKTGQCHQ